MRAVPSDLLAVDRRDGAEPAASRPSNFGVLSSFNKDMED